MIVQTKKEKYKVSKYLSLIVPATFEEQIRKNFEPSFEILEENIKAKKKPITTEDVMAKIANASNLTFNVTNNCNLRCEYCGYSGKYDHSRTHSDNSMDFDIYRKAIDLFFKIIGSPLRTKRRNLLFAFYGGEPLLEFNNILKACDYISDVNQKLPIKKQIAFILTTNAVLLTKKRAKSLLERDFQIDISLDGPKDQHDQFRIKVDKTGSFDHLQRNLQEILDIDEKYIEKLRFFITIHPYHDIKRIEEFFISNDKIFNYNNIRISWVKTQNLNKHVFKKWQEGRSRQIKQITDELDKESWFYRKLIKTPMESIDKLPTQNLAVRNEFTGNCFPITDKIFVSNDGTIHMCERVPSGFPIGHVDTGIDYEAIQRLKNQWNKEIVKRKCWDCEVWWLCSFCFASQAKYDSFEISKKNCRDHIKFRKRTLFDYLNVLEKEDESKNTNCYSSAAHYLESL